MRRHIDFVRLVAMMPAGTFVGACMRWQTQSLQPERFRTADGTQMMRLTLTSGDRVIVFGPLITGDSLVGMQTRPGSPYSEYHWVSIPLAAISQAEVRKNDPGPTVALLVSGLLAAGVVMVYTSCGRICPAH